MSLDPTLLATIRAQLAADGARALRAQRVTQRHARLVCPEVLSAEQARVCDLNRVVSRVVHDAQPLGRMAGVPLTFHRERRPIAVALLVRHAEDTLAAAIDLCLNDPQAHAILIRTASCGDRAIVLIERRVAALAERRPWRTLDPMAQPELLVGTLALRAVGGSVRLLQKGHALRAYLELPLAARPQANWPLRAEVRPNPTLASAHVQQGEIHD
ncbi:MAG: hypothetical protein IT371_12715 [Deltaproteobacteria bacterium]|nr:hypothetical protein [Deltaproteobacteria bacterium]